MMLSKQMYVVLLATAFACATPIANAQKAKEAADPRIARIRQQYAAIDSPAKHYTVRKWERAYETSNDAYTGYYDGKKLRKIVVVSSGEHDEATTKFYGKDGQVFFIHRLWTRFDSLADNKGVTTEQRFYLAQNRLIRWLGKDNVPKPVDSAEARTAASTLLALQREAAKTLNHPQPAAQQ